MDERGNLVIVCVHVLRADRCLAEPVLETGLAEDVTAWCEGEGTGKGVDTDLTLERLFDVVYDLRGLG